MTPSGDPGWLCVFYSQNADGTLNDEVAQYILTDTRVKLNDFLPEGMFAILLVRLFEMYLTLLQVLESVGRSSSQVCFRLNVLRPLNSA